MTKSPMCRLRWKLTSKVEWSPAMGIGTLESAQLDILQQQQQHNQKLVNSEYWEDDKTLSTSH